MTKIEIEQDEYLDCIKSRETIIKIAIDLYQLEKAQATKSKVKPKKKPTITQWHARGAHSVAKWMIRKYPELIKIGLNPKLYDGLNTKIYGK